MPIKKIEYLVPDLLSGHIKENYPAFVYLMKMFGRFLDENNYSKILNIEDNLYAYTIYSELLDLFLDEFFNETFDFNIVNLTDDNKKRFIDLAKKISSTKGNKQSFFIFFRSFVNLSLATESGTVSISDFGTLSFYEPTDVSEIFQYTLAVTTSSLEGYDILLSSVHPAGMLFDIIGTFVPYFGFLEDSSAYGFGDPSFPSLGGNFVS